MVLFHHNPDHDDEAVDEVLTQARELARKRLAKLEIVAACEGLELTV